MKRKTIQRNTPANYIYDMFLRDNWAKYIAKTEKEAVISIWKLDNRVKNNREKILDLGMGPGRWSDIFIKLEFRDVAGLDIDERMVRLANKNINNKRFRSFLADMQNLPFNNFEFDKVFTFRAIKYVKSIDSTLGEIHRVLKSGGTAFIEFPNSSLLIKFIRYIFSKFHFHKKSRVYRYIYNSTFYSDRDLNKVINKNKFKLIKMQPLFVLPATPLPVLSNIYPPIWIILDKILFRYLPKKLFCRSWLVLIKK